MVIVCVSSISGWGTMDWTLACHYLHFYTFNYIVVCVKCVQRCKGLFCYLPCGEETAVCKNTRRTRGIVTVSLCHIVQDCVNTVSCVGRVWYVWAVGRKCEKNMTDSSQSRKWQTIVWSHYGAILDLLDNENNGSQAEVVLPPVAPHHTRPACGDRNKIQGNNANVIQCKYKCDWNGILFINNASF